MKLSTNFYLSEFLVSETARRAGKTIGQPPPPVLSSLRYLVENCLQPLRTAIRKPIVVISGYRPDWLNKMVGGSKNSQHMLGEAADIYVPSMSNYDLCQEIIALDSVAILRFDQLINEFPPQGWVHISCSEHQRRGIILTAMKNGRRTMYAKGLYHA